MRENTKLSQTKLSIYRSCKDNTGTTCTLQAIYNRIVSGDNDLDYKTKQSRALSQTDKAEYRKYKEESIPAVAFAGTFKKRNKTSLLLHSGVLVLDLDDIPPDKIPDILVALAQRNDVVLAFISPSGQGIKIVVRIKPIPKNHPNYDPTHTPTEKEKDPEYQVRAMQAHYEHKAAYKAALDHFKPFLEEHDLSFNLDPQNSDLPRLCILAHHPQAVFYPDAKPIEWDREAYQREREAQQEKQQRKRKGKSANKSQRPKHEAPAILDVQFAEWQKDTELDLNALNYIHPDNPIQINPNDPDTKKEGYEVWYTIGMAIYNEGLPIEVWNTWSQAGDKYSENDTDTLQKKWKSFDNEYEGALITWGSVIEFATVNNYVLSKKKKESTNGKPIIATHTEEDIERKQQGDLIDEVFEKLCEINNPAFLFQNGKGWVEILESDNSISQLSDDAFKYRLAHIFNWKTVQWRKSETDWYPDWIPVNVPKDIAGGVENHKSRLARIPKLEGTINHPILLPDSTIINKRGYVPEHKLFILSDFNVELTDSVDKARETLLKPFKHFIFESDKDRANAFAYLFSLLLRERFPLVPFFAIMSHKGGTGKGKLAKNLHRIAEGTSLVESTWDKDNWGETEVRRQIMGELMEGRAGVFIDNVPDGYTVKSSVLEALATSEYFSGKILYKNERPAYRTWPVWIFSGNNIQFGGMLQRRVQTIAITADVEDPHLRQLPDLDAYVKQHRNTLLNAAYTILVKWQENGASKADISLGNFEIWSQMIGGILGYAGIHGFDPTATEKSDEELALRDFVFVLYEEFGTESFSARDIMNRTGGDEHTAPTLELEGIVDVEDKQASHRLGYILKKLVGQIFTNAEVSIKFVKVDGARRPVNYAFDVDSRESKIPF